MTAKKVLVSLEAWQRLEVAINALPRPSTNLFVTGGPLVDVELHTDRDWALQHAAHLLGVGDDIRRIAACLAVCAPLSTESLQAYLAVKDSGTAPQMVVWVLCPIEGRPLQVFSTEAAAQAAADFLPAGWEIERLVLQS